MNQPEAVKLATIQSDLDLMAITLEERDGKRVLIGRAGETEELIADQPQDGYAAGNPGIIQAISDIRDWYERQPAWGLELLVDWRDYAATACFEARMEGASQVIDAIDLEDAKQATREWAREGDWDLSGGTIWVHANLVETDMEGDQTLHRITVAIDPEEPDCEDGQQHDWQAPLAIVGGIKENPGVWGHGGGVTIQEACVRCGCGKLTDTWATDPATGQQGLRSVAYQPGKYKILAQADDSLAATRERLEAAFHAADTPISYVLDDDGCWMANAQFRDTPLGAVYVDEDSGYSVIDAGEAKKLARRATQERPGAQ